MLVIAQRTYVREKVLQIEKMTTDSNDSNSVVRLVTVNVICITIIP